MASTIAGFQHIPVHFSSVRSKVIVHIESGRIFHNLSAPKDANIIRIMYPNEGKAQ